VKGLPCLLLCALPLAAHMVSMSTGDLKVDGAHASFELRMPMYEVAHVHAPERTLLDHVRFESGGVWAKVSGQTCRQEQDTYVCTAEYQFPAPIETVNVEAIRPFSIFRTPRRSCVSVRPQLLKRQSARSLQDLCARPVDWRRCCFS
jgi:hypothetical protein